MDATYSSSRPICAGFVAIAVVSSLLGFLFLAPPARAAETAESFVAAHMQEGTAILNDTTLPASVRQERFRSFVLSITDPKRIAVFTLGPYARGASEEQLDEYVRSYTEFLAALYEDGLDRYRGLTIRVTGSVARNDSDSVVNAEIVGKENAPPLRIAFRVRKNDAGSLVVTDLQIAGAWLALSQRSDFAAYLQQHRGDVEALSRELTERARQIRSSAAIPPAA